MTGDYDGDGRADVAIFRNNGGVGEWWIRRSSNGSVFAAQFGAATDKTVQGDYTGDGKADIAIWRPSNGNWFILRSEDFSFFAFPFELQEIYQHLVIMTATGGLTPVCSGQQVQLGLSSDRPPAL